LLSLSTDDDEPIEVIKLALLLTCANSLSVGQPEIRTRDFRKFTMLTDELSFIGIELSTLDFPNDKLELPTTSLLLPFTSAVPVVANDDDDEDVDTGARKTQRFPVFKARWELFPQAVPEISV
jgi:hypothetical protein